MSGISPCALNFTGLFLRNNKDVWPLPEKCICFAAVTAGFLVNNSKVKNNDRRENSHTKISAADLKSLTLEYLLVHFSLFIKMLLITGVWHGILLYLPIYTTKTTQSITVQNRMGLIWFSFFRRPLSPRVTYFIAKRGVHSPFLHRVTHIFYFCGHCSLCPSLQVNSKLSIVISTFLDGRMEAFWHHPIKRSAFAIKDNK